MLIEIVWLLVKSYIILILTAAVIRSEEILYDFLRNTVKWTVVALNILIIVCASLWTRFI